MHLIAEKAILASALSAAAQAVERKSTIAILEHALLTLRGDTLVISATNMDTRVEVTISVSGRANGTAVLPAADLAAIVKAMPDGSQIEIKPDGESHFRVAGGRSRYKVPALKPDDFPAWGTGEPGTTFSLSADALGRMLDLTAPFTSTEETRYYLCGIYLHIEAGQLVAAATDGHRLAKVQMAAPEGADPLHPIIIPRQTLGLLQRLRMTGDVTIEADETRVAFRSGTMLLMSKVIDGTYPDYRRVIPDGGDIVIEAEAKDLKATAARVALMAVAEEKSKARAVRVTLSDGTCSLQAAGNDGAEAEEELPLLSSRGTIEIGFNARYMADFCAACGDGPVTMTMSDPGSPVLMRPTADEGATFVLMPMRVN